MKHALDTNIAKQYGVNIALLLENFQFWTLKNFTRKKHIHDGLCWSYDTLDALCEVFPYWTKRQIEHTINNAVKHGLLVRGNYNQTKYDRTVWYALTPKSYVFFPDLLDEKYMNLLYLSISQNCEIDYTEFRNGFPKIVTTIPDTDPPTDPNINNIGISDETPSTEIVVPKPVKLPRPKGAFSIEKMLEDNPHELPQQALEDWQQVRAKKRAVITKTAWEELNDELDKLKKLGKDPIACFKSAVGAGWQSLKSSWFTDSPKPGGQWDIDSVMRA